MPEKRGKYDPEIREAPVRVVTGTRKAICQVADDLGISHQTLANWVTKDKIGRGERLDPRRVDPERMNELERDVAELKMERDVSTEWGMPTRRSWARADGAGTHTSWPPLTLACKQRLPQRARFVILCRHVPPPDLWRAQPRTILVFGEKAAHTNQNVSMWSTDANCCDRSGPDVA